MKKTKLIKPSHAKILNQQEEPLDPKIVVLFGLIMILVLFIVLIVIASLYLSNTIRI